MRDGLTNSLAIALPATIIRSASPHSPHTFAWIDFRGREVLFIATVSLLAIPLQIALVPLVQLYAGGGHSPSCGSTRRSPCSPTSISTEQRLPSG